jgi:hypothetical protein
MVLTTPGTCQGFPLSELPRPHPVRGSPAEADGCADIAEKSPAQPPRARTSPRSRHDRSTKCEGQRFVHLVVGLPELAAMAHLNLVDRQVARNAANLEVVRALTSGE